MSRRFSWTACVVFALTMACGDAPTDSIAGGRQTEAAKSNGEDQALHTLEVLPADSPMRQQWTGDLDGMEERRYIRALVTYSKTNYFLDGAEQRGVTYEALKEFERVLNEQLGRKTMQLEIVILPVRRDELMPLLVQGYGDLAAANLTVTLDRLAQVDFSMPIAKGVSELVVSGPAAPQLAGLDDLSGAALHIRPSSSYWASVQALNVSFKARGLAPVEVMPAQEFLEDEDLLEMVNAGLIPAVIVDSHKAKLWASVFDQIVVHEDIAVRTGGEIAWAFRKNSPQLEAAINAFVKKHRQGTLFGNVILNRYFKDNKWVRNPLAAEDRQRFDDMVEVFKKYGELYDFDHLMLTALAYQESRLNQDLRSRAGAVGVMQMLPSTARDPNVAIPKIDTVDSNVHAGTKYLRFIRDRYFSDASVDPVNQVFFTFAAYNAGPAKIRRLRDEASTSGLDPNVWFENVEVIAARQIGRETVNYVSNIAKYWVAYRLALRQLELKQLPDP